MTFKFPDGEIRAHKVILTTRVLYFEKMFSSGFKESLTGNVNLPEDDMESFDIFLRYIYGAILPNSFDVERQLHYAKMYDVPDLVSQCLPMLKRKRSCKRQRKRQRKEVRDSSWGTNQKLQHLRLVDPAPGEKHRKK